MKNDKDAVKNYLNQQPAPSKRFRSSFVQQISTTVSSSTASVNPLLVSSNSSSSIQHPSPIPSSSLPNVPIEIQDRENYLKSNEYRLIRKCLSEIGATGLDDFFTEDITSDQALMETLSSFAYSLDTFNSLRMTYKLTSKKARKSQQKEKLDNIDLLCSQLLDLFKKCADCKRLPSMNVNMITQTYMKKAEYIKEIISKVGQIHLLVSNSSLSNDLKRRIKQQEGGKLDLTSRNASELTECFSYNDSKKTREETFDSFIKMERETIFTEVVVSYCSSHYPLNN